MNEQQPKTPRQLMEEAAQQLEDKTAVARIESELGEYADTYEDGGRRFYYEFDRESGKRVRVYLADGEEPPKKADLDTT